MGNYVIVDDPQRSEGWFRARLGRLTGSRAADMLSSIKTGEAAARRNLRTQLVLERLTGKSGPNDITTPAMQRGIDLEPIARAAYEARQQTRVLESPFLQHTSLLAGCSPDGILGSLEAPAGIIEIKCPGAAIHLQNLRTQFPAYEYEKQILHNLWITGAECCDFISYHPDFPAPLDLMVTTVWRDEHAVGEYEYKARVFLMEVDRELAELQEMMEARAA